LSFRHGIPKTQYWVPGSNVFVVGETAQINCAIGGLSLNAKDEIDLVTKIALIDQEGVSVDMEPLFFNSPASLIAFAELKSPWLTRELYLAQPGKFVLKIEIEDINAQKKELYEIPLYVLDPNEYSDQPIGFNGKDGE